jgi:2-isopropylmalate synthase
VPRGPDPAHLRVASAAPTRPSSTSTTRPPPAAQGGVRLDKDGITEIAVNAAKLCRKLEEEHPETRSATSTRPESYTGTEVEYAVEICDAVAEVIEPTPDKKLIMNLPATVEMYTPNLYADTIEWFLRT